MKEDEDAEFRVPLVPLPTNTLSPSTAPFEQAYRSGDDDEESTSYGREGATSPLPFTQGRRRSKGFVASLRQLFQRGNDIESSRVNHHFTREERERLKEVEAIDYLAPNSEVYRAWMSFQPHRRTWDRWFMMGSIGATVGLLGYCLYTAIEVLAETKYHITHTLIERTNVFVAWVVNVLYSSALVFASACAVVFVAPAASGAGVAEVMAYLNGCRIPRLFNIRTLLVKFFSCATAVGSGLPVGPEGPMVHIGALTGAALSQGSSTTLQCSTGLFTRFRNPKDKRDFVTAGAAVGIATAFGAPIGGLLFVFEEVASFWAHELGWHIFFACTAAVLALDTLRSTENALHNGVFGWFSGSASTVLYEVETPLAVHLAFIGPAILIGLFCGLLGILFTVANIKVVRLRDQVLGNNKWRRVMEPVVIIAIFVTLSMWLPLFFPCTPTQCFAPEEEATIVCPEGVPRDYRRVVEQSLELYTCRGDVHRTVAPPSEGSNTTQPLPKSYNELATLISVPGESAIRHLLTRGTHREFGYAALVLMLATYFTGAVISAGSSVASGLFVPMLLIGALMGRLVGLAATDIAAAAGFGSAGAPPGVFLPPSPWSWIDPGAFALVGAGAFMGGVTRLTVSVAVIMMEVSNDLRTLIPCLVGIMVAKWVADAVAHPLYHAMLEIKCVPFLPRAPVSKTSLELVEAKALMHYPVVTVKESMKICELRDALRDNKHNGFPVVRESGHGRVFVGLVTRDHVLVLLRRAVGMGTTRNLAVPYAELNRQFVSKQALELVDRQSRAVLGEATLEGFPGVNGRLLDESLDLRPYINNSAFAVHESFSAERTYFLFSTMGLRHLVVVDDHNRVKGIITRKDLLGYRLDEAVDRTRGGAARRLQDRPMSAASADNWMDE